MLRLRWPDSTNSVSDIFRYDSEESVGSLVTRLERVADWLSDVFGIDTRSLAVFRIGLALTILLDLVLRAQDLGAHYTDAGVLPRALLAA